MIWSVPSGVVRAAPVSRLKASLLPPYSLASINGRHVSVLLLCRIRWLPCAEIWLFFFSPFFLCSLPYTSKLVKTLLYNFIRQEKPPPPGTHVFPPQSDGGGLLYGLASGVASKSFRIPIPYLYKLRLIRPKKFCSLGRHHYPFYWICVTGWMSILKEMKTLILPFSVIVYVKCMQIRNKLFCCRT